MSGSSGSAGSVTLTEIAERLWRVLSERELRVGLPADTALRTRQLRDLLAGHVLPRLRSLDAPLLVLILGPTGAGKSSVLNALAGDKLPVYGDGMQVRNWLHVTDFATAIDAALERGEPGRVYNVGGPDELPNIEVVRRILELTGRDESLIEHVEDRLGHDRRYSLSADRISEELGWEAAVRFDEGIADTVAWYRDNEEWWGPIRSGEYREYYERRYGRSLG